ncbi:helix-turn-helix transcriptional regulator [Bradyrhizobium sp. B025]|uniref:helix-turn-helix transcriptional regulator n=1 Tax=Bradyrhizobium sp. B025 TaxID=3344829 RepID=UPI0035D427B0
MSQAKAPNEPAYFRPRLAADYLNTSTSTLAKRRLYGGGPKFSRIGRAIRYAKADLDEFMALSAVSSTTEGSAQIKQANEKTLRLRQNVCVEESS